MKPQEILELARRAGLAMRVNGATLAYRPAERMTPELRELLVAHKPEVIALLNDAHQTAAELIDAAMHVCDYWGDGHAGREQMRRECLDIPPGLQADLLAYFRKTYGGTQ